MSEMMAVPVTQFMLPDGRRKAITVERPREIAERAHKIIGRGLRFEAEVLMTGQVSLTVSDPGEEVDLFIEISPNGPEVLEAFDRLVLAAEEEPTG